MRILRALLGTAGLALLLAGLAWTHRWMGGDLRVFVQPEALAVVAGGTAVALWISFPARARNGALGAALDLSKRRAAPVDTLVPIFVALAYTARRQGWTAVEGEIARMQDPFLARALTLSVSGLAPDVVRETLDVEARLSAEREEEQAQVFDAAARSAPTLGVLGGVLGLMRAFELAPASWSGGTAHGVAAALVATVYGVGLASLVFQPLATRLRARARVNARRRDLTIHGVLALRDGASPSVVEERLAGYLQRGRLPLANVA
jgi:chemotaxis protein MotA